jgi:hypothetical protein
VIASGYALDLYCDKQEAPGHHYNEFPHQYSDEHRAECRRRAKQDGWKINWRKGTAICPKCATAAKDTA